MLVEVTKSQHVIENISRTFTMQGLTPEAITVADKTHYFNVNCWQMDSHINEGTEFWIPMSQSDRSGQGKNLRFIFYTCS